MKTTTYTIPKNLMAEFDNISNSRSPAIQWTPEMDAVLTEFWYRKDQAEIVVWFKKKYGCGSYSTLLRRVRELCIKKSN